LIGRLATLGLSRYPSQPDDAPRPTFSIALGCLYN
jgi:hypothetical protein